ncbi:4993_t:CDS:2, partial [Funneliformis geosporum]
VQKLQFTTIFVLIFVVATAAISIKDELCANVRSPNRRSVRHLRDSPSTHKTNAAKLPSQECSTEDLSDGSTEPHFRNRFGLFWGWYSFPQIGKNSKRNCSANKRRDGNNAMIVKAQASVNNLLR